MYSLNSHERDDSNGLALRKQKWERIFKNGKGASFYEKNNFRILDDAIDFLFVQFSPSRLSSCSGRHIRPFPVFAGGYRSYVRGGIPRSAAGF